MHTSLLLVGMLANQSISDSVIGQESVEQSDI